MIGQLQRLARDAVALLTGNPPEVRNRLKFFLFFLLSPIYDGFYRVVPIDPHHAIERRLPPETHRVLDLCTGTALVPAVLATHPDVFVAGLDLSPEMLAMGRIKLAHAHRTNAALVRADAGRLPFRDHSFDAVTVSFGLHELPTAVRDRAAREAARVLRPGGALVVADLDRPPRFGWLVDVYMRLGDPAHACEVTVKAASRPNTACELAVESRPLLHWRDEWRPHEAEEPRLEAMGDPHRLGGAGRHSRHVRDSTPHAHEPMELDRVRRNRDRIRLDRDLRRCPYCAVSDPT